MESPSPNQQQQRVVWWALWTAFQAGIVIIYVVLGKQTPASLPHEPGLWQLGFIPVLISGAIRWSLLPMMKDALRGLPFFIVGIALAEATCFIGLFVFPSHKTELFAASAIGIFQFIPIFLGRFFDHPEE
jgi:hypothetical protein